ncbi:DUF1501 domain-containing protein [Stigmatella sp. ncwal1]|uniref:DUF1501 domain-containing protein n=1 Tax=Stigmatella ashevillensis TaxID=2995309 RepID=A0ABT5DAE2_9BACT|nr:DUF1501 domain-containing protein [Stigmatella ashevillena]MDC0710075.1 DUF1501 domain-containing protein [Stigmatella ashevillena]
MSPLSRRALLKSASLSLLGLATLPPFLARAAEGLPPGRRKVLLTLFLRGGADGLSLLPPVRDPDYHRLRPRLALGLPGTGDDAALPLDDTFGLHPALAPLLPWWREGVLAAVPAVGLPLPVRSHFDAQDFVESGTPGLKSTRDGYLNRALRALPADPTASAFRAVALQPTLPRALAGEGPALALESLEAFRIRTPGREGPVRFEALYASAVDEALRTTGLETSHALELVADRRLAEQAPLHGARYPRSPLGRRLKDLARLIHAEVGLQLAATEAGGWDTHIQQGRAKGPLAQRAEDLALSLAAFATDLGPRLADVLVVVFTEFGRTARENGNLGTDHGTGGVALLLGGGVRGGRVWGPWKGLSEAHLLDGRDVPSLTDIRALLAEALILHGGLPSPEAVFPGLGASSPRLGLLGG